MASVFEWTPTRVQERTILGGRCLTQPRLHSNFPSVYIIIGSDEEAAVVGVVAVPDAELRGANKQFLGELLIISL